MNVSASRSRYTGVISIVIVGLASVAANAESSAATGVAPPAVSADWWSSIQSEVTAREYRAAPTAPESPTNVVAEWQAPNRGQNFRTCFTRHGIRVVPREQRPGEPSVWEWGMQLRAWGRPDAMRRADPIAPTPMGNRVEYQRGPLTEWYVNDARGLEQGFTISEPPPGDSSGLHIELAITGNATTALSADARSVEFRATGDAAVIRLVDLRATDAAGQDLPAWVMSNGGCVTLAVDDDKAIYPLTIDPLVTVPVWTAESDQIAADFGLAVASAGDVNSDGYDDVIVGAPYYDNGLINQGRAFLFLGSPAGPEATPAWTADGDQTSAFFGDAVASAGDVNGDGYDDVIVGAPSFAAPSTEGKAYVYFGSPSGLNATPAWTVTGNQSGAYLGFKVTGVGDVNADGYSDVAVGAPSYDNDQADEGRVYVYLGSPTGPALTPSWIAEGNQDGAGLSAVAPAGDVNADGYGDVIVGAPGYDNKGRASLYLGSAAGLNSMPDWTVDGDQDEASLGASVATAGDVNNDGYSDVIVSAYRYDNGQEDEGRAYVYLGSAAGLAITPIWTAESNQASAWFGNSVASAGDINGDGYGDVMVSAPRYDHGETDEGRITVYLGTATGLALAPAWTAEGDQDNANAGYSVASAGDVNGDGVSDVIIGAPFYSNGQTLEGRATVYLGSDAGLPLRPAWTAEGDQNYALFGDLVATAGDVNGDGYGDVIVGAPYYDSGAGRVGRVFVFSGSEGGLGLTPMGTVDGDQAWANFGSPAATAGDVNGDGYSDIIVGAQNYNNGQSSAGRALVYLGSAAGIVPTPAWSAEGDQQGAYFGASVATAGDVNGDGYADVIVGAPYPTVQHDGGEAFVYLGSSAGVSATPSWTAAGDQNQDNFGFAVASAGDVNGDGYSDVMVGAYGHDGALRNNGKAFLYLGSAAGLAPTPAWTSEGETAQANLGYSVNTAGDVNGDGYSDVIVAAPRYDNGEAEVGRVYLFAGSAAGLGAMPAWTTDGEQATGFFGVPAGTAGDVNSDGYSDVVVSASQYENGQPREGRVYLYLGSQSGLAVTPGWTNESNLEYAYFGDSVGTAGDVDGDRHGDLIVAWVGYGTGEAYTGRVTVYSSSLPVIAGDCDDDGDLDATDYAAFVDCMAGPKMGYTPECPCADTDGDGDGDLRDFAAFQQTFTGGTN